MCQDGNVTLAHPLQEDTTSCGVFALKVGRGYVTWKKITYRYAISRIGGPVNYGLNLTLSVC